jgi:hypothetical protein
MFRVTFGPISTCISALSMGACGQSLKLTSPLHLVCAEHKCKGNFTFTYKALEHFLNVEYWKLSWNMYCAVVTL